MGRYKVLIEKLGGLNVDKPVTRIEVRGYLTKGPISDEGTHDEGPSGTSESDTPVDIDGNVTASSPPSVCSDHGVRLASFDITNPVARFVRIVTCPNGSDSRCVIWEAISVSKTLKEEKSIQILHKRKSAGRVRSCSEATSVILNRTVRTNDADAGSDSDEAGTESEEEEMIKHSTSAGKLKTFRIDLHDLKTCDKVTLRVDTERDSVDYDAGSGQTDKVNSKDENGNAHAHVEETPETVPEPQPHCSNTEPSEVLAPKEAETEAIEVNDLPASPITMHINVANDLAIVVDLDNNFERLPGTETGTAELSTQSLVEPDTMFYLPYQDIFLAGLPGRDTSIGQSPAIPGYLKEKLNPERMERKKILRKLILDRLLTFGTPNLTAHDITDTWYTGYVQHRALSYRVPKIRVVPKEKSDGSTNDQNKELVKPVQIKLGSKLPDSLGFIEAFIYHANYLKGILNSATCTALECTFYLMIPHFKTQTDTKANSLPGGNGISSTFIKDWIYVLSTAAFQLKPTEPGAVHDLVKKETKVVKHLLEDIVKEHKKMKERIRYIQDKVEILREKTHERIKVDPEVAFEIQNDEEPKNYHGFAHMQIVGFTGPDIFPKFLHFLTGKYGLFLKKDITEAWFPFSDLNFLERRVIFLGLMDHFHSSFNSVLTTVRHLQEIYTPGYPMNLLTRFKPLFDLLNQPKPCQLMATESKLALYGAACGCVGALKRFKFVYKELLGMVKSAKGGLEKFDYCVGTCAEFNAKLGSSDRLPKLNLIVPFATLNLEGFANLSQRGTSVPVEETEK